MDRVEEGIGRIMGEVSDVRTTLGRAPDPVTGTAGSGAVGILYRLGNTLLTGDPRSEFESFLDDESEDTKVQRRPDLVRRSRVAEDSAKTTKDRLRLALIGLGVTTVTTIGTVLIAWLTQGH